MHRTAADRSVRSKIRRSSERHLLCSLLHPYHLLVPVSGIPPAEFRDGQSETQAVACVVVSAVSCSAACSLAARERTDGRHTNVEEDPGGGAHARGPFLRVRHHGGILERFGARVKSLRGFHRRTGYGRWDPSRRLLLGGGAR